MKRLTQFFGQKKKEDKKNEKVKKIEYAEEKEKQILKIIKGYPKTRTPFVPRLLKQAVHFKTIEDSRGVRRVGFTLARESAKTVEPESLEMIRKKLLKHFSQFPTISRVLRNPLPRNTIAISFGKLDFEIGDSCQDFSPIDREIAAKDSFITYQQLSENVQVTYHNKGGVESLAGFCYYAVLNGKPKLLANDSALIDLALSAAEKYPVHDGNMGNQNIDLDMLGIVIRYGRYCRKAGRRVTVFCSGLYGNVRHEEFSHISKRYKYTSCEECFEDSLTYKLVDPRRGTSPAAITTIATQQHGKTLEEQILQRIQDLVLANIDGSRQFDGKISIFNRNTGEFLESSKLPKITDLPTWLDANPDYNVHFDGSLLAHLALGSDYKDRTGGNILLTSVSSVSFAPSTFASNGNPQMTTTQEVSSKLEEPVSSDSLIASKEITASPISSNAEKDPEAPMSPGSSIPPSSASSTESLLEDYEKIDEEITEHNEEFNAEMIN